MAKKVVLIKQFGAYQAGSELEANEILYKHLLKGGWIVEVERVDKKTKKVKE